MIDDAFPTIYRIDRIAGYKVLDEHFKIPYSDRFEEGEFRKRVQFMYGGKLQKIKFRYKGGSIEAVLDRLLQQGFLIKRMAYTQYPLRYSARGLMCG